MWRKSATARAWSSSAVLERELPAERAALRVAGRSVPRLGEPFSERLVEFLSR